MRRVRYERIAKRATVLFVAGLSGCAPQIIAANERGGIINHVSGVNHGEAFKTADVYCHQKGLVARVANDDWIYNQMTFDCIAP